MDLTSVAQIIAFVGILVFLSHLFTGIFSKTRIPDVLLLIAIGICVGPVFNLASTEDFGAVGPIFTTVTLIIILFESGLTLKLSMLKSALGGAMILAPAGFFLTMLVVAGIGVWLIDLEVLPAFILGAIVGSTSEAVVIPLVKQLKIKEETTTLLSVESSVNDVLSIVITIALIQAYVAGKFEVVTVSGDLIASFLVALVFGIIGALIWSSLLHWFHQVKNAIFTTPAFVFVIYGLTEWMGFSGAIAALAFGVTIGNIQSINIPLFKKAKEQEEIGLNETEKVFFSEVAFLLKSFFFIYLGISLQLISQWLIIVALILTGVAFIVRIPAVKFSIREKMEKKDLSVMAVMVPKGLAAVVLASIPVQMEVAGAEVIRDITYGVVLFSIVVTSILVLFLEKTPLPVLYAWMLKPVGASAGTKSSYKPAKIASPKKKTLVPAGERLFGQPKTEEVPKEPEK